MRRRALLARSGAAATVIALWACTGRAVPTKKVPRLGLFQGTNPPDPAVVPLLDAFDMGLRDLGYIDGRTIQIERRYTQNRSERFDEIAAEFAKLPVDVIVGSGAVAIRAARRATSTIPIVMLLGSDPVETGVVQSMARPGGNVTGLGSLTSVTTLKRLELLREAFPGITRIAMLADSDLSREPQRKIAEEGARSLKLEVIRVDVDVTDASNLPRALDLATTSGADALLVTNVPIEIINRRREIIAYAASRRIPAAYPVVGGFADDGGLMATGDNGLETFRRAANFVDRILKGANPADLPIEQPTQNELVVNLKTAKELGLVIPASIVGRATKVIQ